MSSFTLRHHEITVAEIHRNLPPSALYEHAILAAYQEGVNAEVKAAGPVP